MSSSREPATEAPGAAPQAQPPAIRPRSLRLKIVTSVVITFALVLIASGVLTVVALQRAMLDQLDADLDNLVDREVAFVLTQQDQDVTSFPSVDDEVDQVPRLRPPGGGDRQLLLVVARADGGEPRVQANYTVTLDNRTVRLNRSQAATVVAELDEERTSGPRLEQDLNAADLLPEAVVPDEPPPQDIAAALGVDPGRWGPPVRVQLGTDIGSFRLLAQDITLVVDGVETTTTVIAGLPLGGVQATTFRAVSILVPTSLASLLAAALISALLVRRDLAPLDRVARTVRRVSRQELEHGEVRVRDRVEPRDTDPQTEVGQVGQALNHLLDTMEQALSARYESEQRVRQFVADASHELRTPLASIRGYAELSRRETEPVPPTVRHALGRVESEALRMQGLVEDLLLLARLDSGRPLEHEPVDLTFVCLDVVADARVAGPGHRWELQLPEEPVETLGDEGRLRQVLVNLLANARVHTPEGTTVVTALARVGDRVRLTVTDDGPGVPEALRDRVFQRFARGDDSRSRAAGSTGLGLSIVDAVVRAHRGTVTLDSRPGRTCFTVDLPAVPCPQVAP